MSSPLRLEFAGALYHVTSRGNERKAIYQNEADHQAFLELMAQVCERFNWVVHAYCLMTNHYHLLLETPDANLSGGMRQLNGVYTQTFNRTHKRVGHLFQGRFKAILVQKDSYLLEVSRYIVLNPVRAAMVDSCEEWPWSSYCFTCHYHEPPPWLAVDQLLSLFGSERSQAIRKYQDFVLRGVGKSLWPEVKQLIYLGSDSFVSEMQSKISCPELLSEIPTKQKRLPAKPLDWYVKQASGDRNRAIQLAYASGGYHQTELSHYFDLHYGTVSRIISGKSHKVSTGAKGKT
ncbi:REP-associated tyrosine transposase [Rheinheimera mangrovi]|uniref:REP-associated tyrosine transposase n=1 Tax=Rheinheimera mangrovi TaxID=2498451 RepID=UPI000F8C571A|nr:transposase [Rheinheimera mangrovi]